MTVELKGSNLVITIPANTTAPMMSNTGKTLSVASSHGNKPTTVQVKGKPLVVGVNAYIKAD